MAELKIKKIGVVVLTLLVAGNIVGSGVFLLPTSLAKYGSIGIIAWGITAFGAICLALVFAKMGSIMPKTGGPYAYVHEEFGDYVGFQTAYSYWIGVWVGNASLIPALISYLYVFFPGLHHSKMGLVIGLALVWLFTITNIFGVRKAGIIGAVLTILKFVPLVLVAVFGWIHFHGSYLTGSFNVSHQSASTALAGAAALTLWSFVGIESASVPAGDVKNPSRTIPIATIVGTLLAAFAYIISCVVIMGMIPMHTLQASDSPFALAGRIIFGPWGGYIVAMGAIFSFLGGLNGWTLMQSQVAMAAADDELFPKIFGKRNRYGVPVYGLIITSTLVSLILIFSSSLNVMKQFELFILAATVMTLIPYLYTAMAEIICLLSARRRAKGIMKHIIIAVLGGIYSFWAIMGSNHNVLYCVALMLLLSVPFYAIIRVQKEKTRRSSNKM